MRILMLATAVAALGLAACETSTQPPQRTARAQQEYDRLLAGKVAGPAEECLPAFRSNDMIAVDDDTILFRDGRTVYVNHPEGVCSGISRAGYTLVTKSIGGGGRLCRGDIARVVDLSTDTFAGSCALGDFIPFRPARG